MDRRPQATLDEFPPGDFSDLIPPHKAKGMLSWPVSGLLFLFGLGYVSGKRKVQTVVRQSTQEVSLRREMDG